MSSALEILVTLANRIRSVTWNDDERYDVERWRSSFVGSPATPPVHCQSEDVRWVVETYPGNLRRDQIYSVRAADPATRDRRLLIAALAWGYGTQMGRYSNVSNISMLLADPGLSDRLSRCRQHLERREVGDAYQQLTGITGIASAYFTKILYFMGRSVGGDWRYPLILDTRVAQSLASLTGLSQFLTAESYRPLSDPATYMRFVDTLHEWARTLGVIPDALEYYLWRPTQPEFDQACNRHHRASW